MALVLKILQCVAVILATIMFAAAYDVGHFGLKDMIYPVAIGPVVLFAILSIVPIFLSAKSKGGEEVGDEGVDERIAEIQAKLNSRLTALQTKMDDLSGQDRESLAEENQQLKERLEAIQQAEREKVVNDAEHLRQRNQELENQIKQWAIDSVGGSLGDADGGGGGGGPKPDKQAA